LTLSLKHAAAEKASTVGKAGSERKTADHAVPRYLHRAGAAKEESAGSGIKRGYLSVGRREIFRLKQNAESVFRVRAFPLSFSAFGWLKQVHVFYIKINAE